MGNCDLPGRRLRRRPGRHCRVGPAIGFGLCLVLLGCGGGSDDVQLSGDGDDRSASTLAVGADIDDAGATGVDGPADGPSDDAGSGDRPGGDQPAGGDETADGRSRFEPNDRHDLLAFGSAVKANNVLARIDHDVVVLWTDGQTVDFEGGMRSVTTDGRFVYQWVGEGGSTLLSTASTLDGTVICEADGIIDHVTERSDGTHIMAVQQDLTFEEDWDGSQELALSMEAVDCRTGDRQAIEPITIYGRDGEVRFVERIAGREFTGVGDAEGNADIFNEQDVSVNGDDYAGYHTFNRDGSIVIYGDMAADAGPHLSRFVIARDTTTARRLWTAEFELPFRSIDFVDDRVVVSFARDITATIEFDPRVDRAVILDAATGRRLAEVDVGFELLSVG